jgi:hypothetical protein
MRVRFGGRAAILSLVIGAVALAWTPVMGSVALGQPVFLFGPITLVGAVMVLGGLLLLRGSTYFTVADDEIVVHAVVGPIKRRFPFASWDELSWRDGRLWSGGRRVPVHRTQANAEDWQAFERWLEEKQARR